MNDIKVNPNLSIYSQIAKKKAGEFRENSVNKDKRTNLKVKMSIDECIKLQKDSYYTQSITVLVDSSNFAKVFDKFKGKDEMLASSFKNSMLYKGASK